MIFGFLTVSAIICALAAMAATWSAIHLVWREHDLDERVDRAQREAVSARSFMQRQREAIVDELREKMRQEIADHMGRLEDRMGSADNRSKTERMIEQVMMMQQLGGGMMGAASHNPQQPQQGEQQQREQQRTERNYNLLGSGGKVNGKSGE